MSNGKLTVEYLEHIKLNWLDMLKAGKVKRIALWFNRLILHTDAITAELEAYQQIIPAGIGQSPDDGSISYVATFKVDQDTLATYSKDSMPCVILRMAEWIRQTIIELKNRVKILEAERDNLQSELSASQAREAAQAMREALADAPAPVEDKRQGVVDAARAIVKAYRVSPDGPLGKGFTNGHFLMLESALNQLDAGEGQES